MQQRNTERLGMQVHGMSTNTQDTEELRVLVERLREDEAYWASLCSSFSTLLDLADEALKLRDDLKHMTESAGDESCAAYAEENARLQKSVKTLTAQRDEMAKAVAGAEYGSLYIYRGEGKRECPWCDQEPDTPHDDDCEVLTARRYLEDPS